MLPACGFESLQAHQRKEGHPVDVLLFLYLQKCKGCDLVVFLALAQQRGGEMRLLGRVGEMLRLKAQTVAVAVGASALALAGREIVGGIDLHPRLRGGYLHGDARLSAENGGGVLQRAVAAAQHEVVVIALGLV